MAIRQFFMLLSVLLFSLFLVLNAACAKVPVQSSPGDAFPGAASDNPDDLAEITIPLTAERIAFDKDRITVPAGTRVNIAFSNKDGVLRHNFAIYQSTDSPGPFYRGDFIDGGKSINYGFVAPPDQGIYEFRCDAHPVSMNGDLIVAADTD
ncbi:MAG: cupredoxin domain-containing protein [Chloroflexi bacterium]|nr:cupredoxin domain-containing protein [Chloroflexota bacterium]